METVEGKPRQHAYLRAVARVPSSAFFSAISNLVANRSCSGMRGFCSFFKSSSALPAHAMTRSQDLFRMLSPTAKYFPITSNLQISTETMRFESTTEVLAKGMLKYYGIS